MGTESACLQPGCTNRQNRWVLVPSTFGGSRCSWHGLAPPKEMGMGFSRNHNLNPSLGRLSERLPWAGPSGLHRCPISWRSPSLYGSALCTLFLLQNRNRLSVSKGRESIANHEGPRIHIIAATTFEAVGDAVIRIALHHHVLPSRISLFALATLPLAMYGASLNLAPAEFAEATRAQREQIRKTEFFLSCG